MSFNLAAMLVESAAARPDKPFLHAGSHSFSYAEVDGLSGRIAESLVWLGLEPGDKVAVQLPNVPEFVLACFGILKAGLVMVPLNPLLTAPEIAYHLRDSDARLLIAFGPLAGAALKGAGQLPVYLVGEAGEAGEAGGARSFDDLLESPDSGLLRPMSPDDTAVILYTSGTTGRPKGAELTHFQLFMNCTVSGELFGATAEDVSLAVLPLFHVFGLSSVLNVMTRFGGSLVLVPKFDAAAVLDEMERHRCTLFSGVPTMYVALLQQDLAGRDLSSLRSAVSGGASMPGEVLRAFEKKFDGVVVLEGYGLSETASGTTFNISAEQRKVLSIGKPIWGVEVKVVDRAGTELGAGPDQVGEIVVRGHNVMKGYYGRPDATAEAIRDGWFHTGDLGYRDEEGYYFVVDRLKDLVIRGGYNVYPREIEEVLYEHPGVAEAAVVGEPHERLGEEVVAYVVLRAGSDASVDELAEHCKGRLAAYKYPRTITLLDRLPKGPTGKILKRAL
ncbi:long-chain fatty acid--CoA ligase [Amycolatopsis sp. AA4]|uniref:long-chain-fatty-acid--CoA ligase n=1 Tax=Actinomycetes TaxID=1760 RepID=UPI0001B545B7|nr:MULTISPECIES: long-chain fatty acid--CoA ligase [Actinomycetes]ATY13010.1 long-chain fatty acid--CoA ligase [Amycolatopsis sp. AA4]EFL08880.1 O-succinylbenzoate-CoA ligase [Streptomyces sp. AA4]